MQSVESKNEKLGPVGVIEHASGQIPLTAYDKEVRGLTGSCTTVYNSSPLPRNCVCAGKRPNNTPKLWVLHNGVYTCH